MKFIFRLIGIVVVLAALILSVLVYLDGKGLLSGDLENLITTLRRCGTEAWTTLRTFFANTDIGEDAAGLLDKGADFLRGTTPTPVPVELIPNS